MNRILGPEEDLAGPLGEEPARGERQKSVNGSPLSRLKLELRSFPPGKSNGPRFLRRSPRRRSSLLCKRYITGRIVCTVFARQGTVAYREEPKRWPHFEFGSTRLICL